MSKRSLPTHQGLLDVKSEDYPLLPYAILKVLQAAPKVLKIQGEIAFKSRLRGEYMSQIRSRVRKGADATVKDKRGETPLDVADLQSVIDLFMAYEKLSLSRN